VYVRVGSTNRCVDAELIEELRRFSRGEGFDEQPLPGLASEAIDFRAASESFAPLRALQHRDLETLRLVSGHQGKTVPTVGGMILFGHDRERHFPDAWIQAGRFAGSDMSRILDRIEIHHFHHSHRPRGTNGGRRHRAGDPRQTEGRPGVGHP
jgi:ATP-dependent DNA helicase RecG